MIKTRLMARMRARFCVLDRARISVWAYVSSRVPFSYSFRVRFMVMFSVRVRFRVSVKFR